MRHLLFLFSFLTLAMWGQSREVAITFDDLPRGGDTGGHDLKSVRRMTVKLLDELKGVPVIGFVNAGRADDMGAAGLQTILRIWLDHGAELGNHTYSHPDLNKTPLDEYTADVVRGEPAIVKARGHRPRYFRHPFLHAGADAATKRGLEKFLAGRGYQVAPVTLDNSDWMFAFVYANALKDDAALAARARDAYVPYMESIFAFFETRSVEVVGREFPQVLLLHANQLNADTMPALLDMMRRRGYRFVSLEEALRDDAYRLPDEYAGKKGFSWIHRWSLTKGMAPKYEPDEPEWIDQEYQRRLKRVVH
ncbi:MAG: polysaccharide deacetylase family protein [Bryobacteraceae bacterium]|jgi:peptidoglycan/xylan/chitin deacetylase (PgdA/CDA1 family)